MNTEAWRDISGYEGRYRISNYGRVYSHFHGRILTPKTCGRGYQGITLSYRGIKQRFYIHRLVADCFLPAPKTGEHEVNHKDLNKQNNQDSNLEWSTREKNFEHAYSNGKVDFRRPIRCDNKTGKQGVSKQTGGYQVSISYNRCRCYLGWFKDLDTAISVRNKAEKRLIENEVY